MASALNYDKVDRPELAQHESSILDLVFVMDCTGSMGSYIASATENIRSIVQEIYVSEKCDTRLALVEYRDHPPQDSTFVTRVHDFTQRVKEMKSWLEACQAQGGGDGPEAVADGLQAILKLNWREKSTKICVLISDAPPHGLSPNGDGFPNGCPCGFDPVQIVREIAEKHITLYVVGVEPSIVPYRDFFMSMAYMTGGQYVPMVNAKLLSKVIIGGVREEISLERLMEQAEQEIERELIRADAEGVDESEKARRVQHVFSSKNVKSKQMSNVFGAPSSAAKDFSKKATNLAEARAAFAAPHSSETSYLNSHPISLSVAPRPTSGFSSMFNSVSSAVSSVFSSPTAKPSAAPTEEISSYDLRDDDVSEEQAARIYQKWQHRKK